MHFMFNMFVPNTVLFMRYCGKYGTGRQATGDNIIQCMFFACWITKATDTHLEYVILFAFSLQQWLTNAPQCYVICTLPLLFLLWEFISIFSKAHVGRPLHAACLLSYPIYWELPSCLDPVCFVGNLKMLHAVVTRDTQNVDESVCQILWIWITLICASDCGKFLTYLWCNTHFHLQGQIIWNSAPFWIIMAWLNRHLYSEGNERMTSGICF